MQFLSLTILITIPLLLSIFFLSVLRQRRPASVSVGVLPESLRTLLKKTRLQQRIVFLLGILALLSMLLALARPVVQEHWSESWTEGIDIMLVLDVSESMDATDFSPNRLHVAKRMIRNFIAKRASDRIGLVMFGGDAVTLSPLTHDHRFVQTQLEAVQTRELKQGTAIGMALANGVARFQNSAARSKVIVLMTDGDNNVGSINPMTASELAKDEGIKIYTIGIGADSRVLVPIYAYDGLGNRTHVIAQVPSYLNPELLKTIATATGARHYMAKNTESFGSILEEINSLEKSRIRLNPRHRTRELFPPFALIALLLLIGFFVLKETRFKRISNVASA